LQRNETEEVNTQPVPAISILNGDYSGPHNLEVTRALQLRFELTGNYIAWQEVTLAVIDTLVDSLRRAEHELEAQLAV
jgi:hypothetical protein